MSRDTADLYAQIEARRAELGLSQAQLAQIAFGKSSTAAVQNIKRGASPSHERLGAIADALGYELYFGPPRDTGPAMTTEISGEDYAVVPRYDANLSAGHGADNGIVQPMGVIAFRHDWLARTVVTPGKASVVNVRGDSMAPTLADGDLVLIDEARKAPRNRRIYALVDPDGEALIKRVERLPDMLLLQSDNDSYPTRAIPARDAERVRILGEVVWWGHTVRD